jgi:hypothetical protein
MRTCQKCKHDKDVSEFRVNNTRSDGRYTWCMECSTEYQRNRRRADPKAYADASKRYRARSWAKDPVRAWARMAATASKGRAKREGVPHAITFTDLLPLATGACPVLGIPLAYSRTTGVIHDASPTVDKMKPELGYVPGNIVVVSFRANAIKRNATLKELEAVLQFYQPLL